MKADMVSPEGHSCHVAAHAVPTDLSDIKSDDAMASMSSMQFPMARTSSMSRKKLMHSDFVKNPSKSTWEPTLDPQLAGKKLFIARILNSEFVVTYLMLGLIILDFICALIDVDTRAAGQITPYYTFVVSELCLFFYTAELIGNFYVRGCRKCLQSKVILFDSFCCGSGYMATFVSAFHSAVPAELQAFGDVRVLRVVRILRVGRITRIIQKTRYLRELQKLIAMMLTCMKALTWSFIFCFGFMTMWAMLLVEFVHPLMKSMQRDGALEGCKDCADAASSVMQANLLLFKTVIAGDSWGQIAVPVIDRYPATAIIFCGSMLTLVFGVLNMVLAVVVDSFAESRQKDLLHLAEELELENEQDKKRLENIFTRLDCKNKGELTMEELMNGAATDPEFQSRLRVMDIDQADLEQLFNMIDADLSGSIEKDEFVRPLSRWIVDSKTAPRFVKYNVERVLQQQDEILKQSHMQFQMLGSRLDELSQHLLHTVPATLEKTITDDILDGIEQPQVSSWQFPLFIDESKSEAVSSHQADSIVKPGIQCPMNTLRSDI